MPKEEIVGRGAEALLIRKQDILIKRRIKKGYRNNQLDLFLRTSRTRREAKILEKASKFIFVPKVRAIYKVKKFEPETDIEMEFIEGKVLSRHLDDFPLKKALEICKEIGKNTAKLHDNDIIHSDLTTSNMILNEKGLFFIDFGLGFQSTRIEDRAVDLHLMREALQSRHFEHWKSYFGSMLEGYKTSKNALFVIERLKKVEARGRYKGKH